MPEEFSIDVSGIEETCAMLTQAPKQIAKYALVRGTTAACKVVAAGVQQASPIMEDGSIHHNPPPGALKAHVVIDIAVLPDGTGVQGFIGFGRLGFVARMVNFGHRMLPHFQRIGSKRSKERTSSNLYMPVAPNPFMAVATADSADAAVEAFAAAVNDSFAEGIPGIPTKAA